MRSASNFFFVNSLYLATAIALFVAASSLFLQASMVTLVVRTGLAFATFSFLGWVVESILNQAPQQEAVAGRDAEERGALVDVVLPATDGENE